MQARIFIKDKIVFIAVCITVALFSSILLHVKEASLFFILFIASIYLLSCFGILLGEYFVKSSYYKEVYMIFDELDKKTLIGEIITNPRFYEASILCDLLKLSNKAMNDEIAKYRLSSAEYREYIELWVHEIKTPIAGAKLLCENSGNSILLERLTKIDELVEQALFYSRSNTIEKDLLIKELQLKDIVNSQLQKKAKQCIENDTWVVTRDLDFGVQSDAKWLNYILSQIIDNSIKYESKTIEIYAEQNINSISLFITDNGIGIAEKDLKRIFEKGFTGETGRKYLKATGLGLYLCRKMCQQLGLSISVKSQQKQGTIVEIVFPKSSMHAVL